MSDSIKSKLGYEYDLKDALRHNPTIIMAGDETLAVALARIEALKTELSEAKKDVTDMETLALKSEAENARLRAIARNVDQLPPGEWETWTSCSFRRITARGGPDGGVLHATVQKSDGHPDLSWDEETCRVFCDLVNGLRATLEEKTND